MFTKSLTCFLQFWILNNLKKFPNFSPDTYEHDSYEDAADQVDANLFNRMKQPKKKTTPDTKKKGSGEDVRIKILIWPLLNCTAIIVQQINHRRHILKMLSIPVHRASRIVRQKVIFSHSYCKSWEYFRDLRF